jgi:hypothetical protein
MGLSRGPTLRVRRAQREERARQHAEAAAFAARAGDDAMALKLVFEQPAPRLAPPTARPFAMIMACAAQWVVNVRSAAPFDVYVGRPHPRFRARGWGNPYRVSVTQTRADAVGRFWDLIEQNDELRTRIRRELRGKLLGCWCAPQLCHGHVLAWIANDMERCETRSPHK